MNVPCASNDSRNDYSTSLDPCTDTSTFFTCSGAMDGDELINDGATPLTLEFDYEIHTSLDLNDISIAIAEFQNDLAAGVAETYDFKECRRKRELRVSSSGRKLGKYATVVEESTGMETSAPIVGCASVPSDEPDNNISLCVNAVDLNQPSTCTPMKGYLTIYAEDDSSNSNRRLSDEETQQEALAAIASYMRSSTDYLSSDVLAVSFIGTRDIVPVGIMNPALLLRPGFGGNRNLDVPSSNDSPSGSTGFGKSFMGNDLVAAATVSTVFIAVCVAAVRHYTKKTNKTGSKILKKKNSFLEVDSVQVV